MRLRTAAYCALLFALAAPCATVAPARAAVERLAPPHVASAQTGDAIERVTITTYGVTKIAIVRRYLTLHEGSRLTQAGVDRDFSNMVRLGGFRPRLEIEPGSDAQSVRLHWIVMNRWVRPTSHPFYGDAPLSAPIQGVGFILTAPPLDGRGSNLSAYTQLSKRANLLRALYTMPLHVDSEKGTASSLIVDAFGGRGVFRASEPKAINVFSWNVGEEALYLHQNTNGTQFETGVRDSRSTDQYSSNLVARSLYNTSMRPARNLSLLAGLSHACLVPAYEWRPPLCNIQYRFSAIDAIGGLGVNDDLPGDQRRRGALFRRRPVDDRAARKRGAQRWRATR